MQVLIELWTPKPSWQALSTEERQAFMAQIGGTMAQLSDIGVEVIGWGEIDPTADKSIDAAFVAVWRAASEEAMVEFLRIIEASGWYDYFAQTNVKSSLTDPQAIVAKHF